MFSKVHSVALKGMDAYLVRVEADISDGMPQFLMVGYLSSEVREAGDRVRTALRNTGILLPPKRITVNLAPASIRKAGTRFDLPVAAAILASMGMIPQAYLQETMLVGELSLNGQVLGVPGILALTEAAQKCGMKRCIVPKSNGKEGAVIKGIEVIGVSSLEEVIEVARHPEKAVPEQVNIEDLLKGGSERYKEDFAELNGQYGARRAAEVAAAGMHNLLMIGPPGAGKTMIAKRIPGILPSLSLKESLEISKIYSIAGLLPEETPLLTKRPFRAPHHTVTGEALAGGGRIPLPGEISLSSRGILFLDELPEFRKNALEILRQPLEERRVCISRASGTYIFPAECMLVAAMNPCSCGYYPDRNKCHCAEREVKRYLGKISQPLLDRVDICTEVAQVSYEDLTEKRRNESSAQIRERVEAAQKRQQIRYRELAIHFNAQLEGHLLEQFCPLDARGKKVLQLAFARLNLSARAYHKIIRVARTIADLEECEQIREEHVLEAIRYRPPNWRDWTEEA